MKHTRIYTVKTCKHHQQVRLYSGIRSRPCWCGVRTEVEKQDIEPKTRVLTSVHGRCLKCKSERLNIDENYLMWCMEDDCDWSHQGFGPSEEILCSSCVDFGKPYEDTPEYFRCGRWPETRMKLIRPICKGYTSRKE